MRSPHERVRVACRGPRGDEGGLLRATWLFPLVVAFEFRPSVRRARGAVTYCPPLLLEFLGRLRAERAAFRAIRRVPAYGRVLREQGSPRDDRGREILHALPETEKRSTSTVTRSRSLHRRHFPLQGHDPRQIEQLHRRPYDWIRSERERLSPTATSASSRATSSVTPRS